MSAGYVSDVDEFLATDPAAVLGQLHDAAARGGYAAQWTAQTRAWVEQVADLRRALEEALHDAPRLGKCGILLEYTIPRRSRRIDAVLLVEGVVVIVEFKVGAAQFGAAAKWQVTEYARDTRDFHLASRDRVILPILVATAAPPSGAVPSLVSGACDVIAIAPTELGRVLAAIHVDAERAGQPSISADEWDRSPYRPALNIVQAVEALFAGHDVREIAHAAADDVHLTIERLLELVDQAQATRTRVACFVTGGPGSGKTLVGLTLANNQRLRQNNRPPGVFLSGNLPLIRVLRAALSRDARRRTGEDLKEAERKMRQVVQSVQNFVATRELGERIVIFDEAQRAWGLEQMRKVYPNEGVLHRSEPEVIIELMERTWDWCVLVALVGGGQEINTGEDGLGTWGDALAGRPGWTVVAPPEAITGDPSLAGQRLFRAEPPLGIRVMPELHLLVSMRAYRAAVVGEWVNAVLAGHPADAAHALNSADEFPVVLTRSLDSAREWLREKVLDRTEPAVVGLLASSNALRLRADGLEVDSTFRRGFFSDSKWFLDMPDDIKSAYRLEVAATEFECQGLELDWTGLCWEGDFTWTPDGWSRRRLRGSVWQQVRDPLKLQFVTNRYRVLLTRARQGTVIYVPRGAESDSTRPPGLFDATADFLLRCGVRPLD